MRRSAQHGPAVGYGVVLAGDHATVVRARRGRKGIEYRVVVDTHGPASDLISSPGMTEMQAEAAAGDAVVNLGLPAAAGLVRWLQTPFTSRSKAQRVLPSLLDIQLPFPLEQCAHALVKVESAEDGKIRALAVAARSAELAELLETARERGIDPALVDHEALALWDSAAASGEHQDLAVIHLSRARGMLAMGHAGRLGSAHALPALDPSAASAALLSRLQRLLRSLRPDSDRPLHWVWTGPAATDPALVAGLESALREEWKDVRFEVAPNPETFLARALARRVVAGDSEEWNLRRDALEHPALVERRRRSARRTAGTALVAGLCLIGVNLAWKTVLDQRNRGLETLIRDKAREMTGLPEDRLRAEPVHVVRSLLASRRGPADPFRTAMAPGVTPVLYQAVALADRLQLSLERFSASEGSFVITGSGPDGSACRRLGEQWASTLSPLEVNLEPGEGGSPVRFTARGVYGSP